MLSQMVEEIGNGLSSHSYNHPSANRIRWDLKIISDIHKTEVHASGANAIL